MTPPTSEPSRQTGRVYLVGAGPGDPGLITVRGKELLQSAEVVVFDYLANPQLLRWCPTAETIYVGKQAAAHSMTQEEINKLLVERGLDGKRVVRLKGGDPYVFGRGGEEGEALRTAGVPFEVVPGITASMAASCYAGIPVTHRDANSSFTIITGHEKEEDYKDPEARGRKAGGAASSDLDWASIARLPSMAFYMGVKALPRICKKLIEHGMPPDMPAASIQWGTTPKQRTVVGTISDLPQKVTEAKLGPPAITIVGRNVALRPTLNWFETRPLFGQTVVVTRTRQQSSDLVRELEEQGARVIEAPTIELAPPKSWDDVDNALKNAGSFDWIVFTSQNGVKHTKQRLLEVGLDARSFGSAKVATVGRSTAQAVKEELCLRVDLCPEQFVAEALAQKLTDEKQVTGKRFLLLRADIGRPVLKDKLVAGKAAEVRDVSVYETKPAVSLPPILLDAMKEKQVNWVTFTSSSTARNFTTLLGKDYAKKLAGVKVLSIGPVTTGTLRELGLEPTVQAEESNIRGMVEAMLKSR